MDTTKPPHTTSKRIRHRPDRCLRSQTYEPRQPEHVSESSPPLHRYLGNSYLEAMATKSSDCKPNSR